MAHTCFAHRRGRALGSLVLAGGLALAVASPAAAQDSGSGDGMDMPTATPAASGAPTTCGADQVTVVVEGAGQGCAPAGVTGAEALEQAGFPVEYVSGQIGFVCTIAGKPENQACTSAPSADEYWAYYHAKPGDTEWQYSQEAATTYRPEAGTVEGWAYGAGAAPAEIPAAGDGTASSSGTDQSTDAADESDGPSAGAIVGIVGVVVVVLALGGGIVAMNRRRSAEQ